MADPKRLTELTMPPPLAEEVANQIQAMSSEGAAAEAIAAAAAAASSEQASQMNASDAAFSRDSAAQSANAAQLAAETAALGSNYKQTLAQALAEVPVGQAFICPEVTAENPNGEDRRYIRVTDPPGYELTADQPVSKNALAAPTGADFIGTADGGNVQDGLDIRPTSLALSSDSGASLIGTADGDSAQAKLDKAVYRGVPFNSAFPLGTQPIAPASALMDINADRDTGDLMHMQTRHRLGMAGYSLHITDTADSGVVAGGAAGFAISGQGYGDAIVGNRYQQGDGNGLLVNRVGTGSGNGIKANFSSLGNGNGAYIIKQPQSGVPGTASGVGHSLYVQNASTNGYAIYSYTWAECAETISNVFERANVTSGVITDTRILKGGTRTGQFTGSRTLLQPDTAWNGTPGVVGHSVGITPNVTGSVEVTGLLVNNLAAGNTTSYGANIQALGTNPVNVGIRVTASGGTGANIAAQLFGEVQLGGNMLPTASNTYQLGSSGIPFTTIYVQNAPVVVSDRNQKQGIRDLNEAEARVANACKALIRVYQLNSEVERDGDGARLHIGSIAQDIAEAFESEGLDAFKYGVVFRDDEGRHGVAYQELFAMIIATL